MHPNSQVRAAAALPYITLQKVTFEEWLEFLRSNISKSQMPSAKDNLQNMDAWSASHRETASGKYGDGLYNVMMLDDSVTQFFDYDKVPEEVLMFVVDNGSVRVSTDLSDPEGKTFVQPLLGSSGSGTFFNWGKENINLPLNLDKIQVEMENNRSQF